MIATSDYTCPLCGGNLKRIGRVKRLVKTQNGQKDWVYVKRYQCECCSTVHREIPDTLYPYKHYSRDIIDNMVDGVISSDMIEYEDYPSDSTIKRWTKEYTKN